jgi:uncharacterized RDD family membrane protein YckC
MPFTSLGTLVTSLPAVAAVIALAALGLWTMATPVSRWIIRARARYLPSLLAERFAEEWMAEADEIDSRIGKLRFAFGLLLTSARAYIEAAGGPAAIPGNLIVALDVKVYSTVGSRILAFAADAAVTAAAALGVAWALSAFGVFSGDERYSIANVIVGLAISTIVTVATRIYPVIRFGGSPGKLLLGLRIVPIQGGTLTWRHALLRAGPEYVLGAVQVAAQLIVFANLDLAAVQSLPPGEQSAVISRQMAGLWWMGPFILAVNVWFWSSVLTFLMTEERRPLHDFLAGTVVVANAPAVMTEADIVPQPRKRIFD